ncbi:hypothetical protein VB773_16100 [Haloarculaceae archaeon H-GB2-1]|nr:hypothetical protein [Haloarculaceae archaeon H-GB2-1]
MTVSPGQPTPGEAVTVEATVQNLKGSSSVFHIDGISLRRGTTEYARVEDVGTLSADSSLTVPLTVTFEEPGTKRLRVTVWGHTDGKSDSQNLRYPVTINVADNHPRLDIDVNESVTDAESKGRVTIANGLDSKIQNVELSVDGKNVEVRNDRDVYAVLESGSEETTSFTFRPQGTEPHTLEATLRYTTDSGTTRTVNQTRRLEPESMADRVVLEATSNTDGDTVSASVLVRNQGNVPVENVTVRADSANATFRQGFAQSIQPGESKRVVLNATMSEDTATADVVATYEAGDIDGRKTTSVELVQTPGTIGLTGLDVVREDGKLHISGSASNLGTTDADSVIVSVVKTDAVTPAYPNRQFFVGTVPASEFVSFDVYATASGDVSSVPLKVTYLVDDERRQRVIDVPLAEDSKSVKQQSTTTNSRSNILVPAAIGGVVILAVGGIILYAWRNSRGGD